MTHPLYIEAFFIQPLAKTAWLIAQALLRPSSGEMCPYSWRALEVQNQTDDHRARFGTVGPCTPVSGFALTLQGVDQPPHQFSKVCE
ncbi:Unknown protein sequence [Pseudomonas savastanoi pv. glycinea]|uniref:Uncharacterized protein n=1 Tax=Pseudomonas savastanoi pv. glycinea TaxID=318 RepID=A0ABR5L4F9_PSESG|nr:Unknown protein sequence [Pseudomonas savastanoi pv. glycinea]KPC35922.1 Unknown protein sequence [Pseudomonas savastanoi pv. glycinea]KPC39301.1 Unknown protein sequence [Pseudomonas savastanoi pv. glycinea]RMM97312.1 hypothetical protein ALQ67_01286 [Pseudomonas savastanoi pv. glycinea]RMM98182.1 hypothetical protein ALQ68_02330 [Pseudomonas savastanoi pv. glycinea]